MPYVISKNGSIFSVDAIDSRGRRVAPRTRMPESPDKESPDKELLRQLSKGKEAAFDTLYERYQGRIFRFAWHMTRDYGTAEEVTQEVFLQIIRKPGSY